MTDDTTPPDAAAMLADAERAERLEGSAYPGRIVPVTRFKGRGK